MLNKILSKIVKQLVVTLGVASITGTAMAGLSAVDPGPYTAGSGYFPVWYNDGTTNLEFCHSRAQSTRVPGAPGAPSYMCTLIANPPIFDDLLPDVFTANWPDEAFYFAAGAAVDATTVPDAQGLCVSYGADIEAAFGTGIPSPNDQITFSRIRIRGNVPVTGTYTVTHPYGVETFVATTATGGGCNGNNSDFSTTRDIGIGGAGNFAGVLNGDVGPYLLDPAGPYTETNPVTGLPETYIGDPNLTTNVTIGGLATAVAGTPVVGGPNGNILRIQGPGGIDVQTNLFTVSGKLFGGQVPVALNVDRSTYRRTTAGGTSLEVFASTPAAATVSYRETVANGTENVMTGDGAGNWYGTTPTQPPLVVVTATAAGNTSSALSSTVTDLVKIIQASYNKDTGELLVQATSSDEVSVPTLTAVGQGALAPTATPLLQELSIPVTEPPAFITIQSTAGGTDTEAVHVISSDFDGDGVPDVVDNCPVTPNPLQEDGDGDGVGDVCDNCSVVVNADQRDTDGDGYGNICDADLNNNTPNPTVNLSDYSLFRAAFGANVLIAPLTTAQENADFNGDGRVNLSDYSIFRASFGKAPGPSGIAP